MEAFLYGCILLHYSQNLVYSCNEVGKKSQANNRAGVGSAFEKQIVSAMIHKPWADYLPGPFQAGRVASQMVRRTHPTKDFSEQFLMGLWPTRKT
jgi:L-serine deaminase